MKGLKTGVARIESLQLDKGRGSTTAHALAAAQTGNDNGGDGGEVSGLGRGGKRFEKHRDVGRGHDQQHQQHSRSIHSTRVSVSTSRINRIVPGGVEVKYFLDSSIL